MSPKQIIAGNSRQPGLILRCSEWLINLAGLTFIPGLTSGRVQGGSLPVGFAVCSFDPRWLVRARFGGFFL